MKRGRALARWALTAGAVALSGIASPPAAVAADPVRCMRDQTPSAPPPGGAVFAGPLEAGTNPNVVVIPAGASWTATGSCASAQQMMTNPSSINVGAGGALLLRGAGKFDSTGDQLTSAWGATDDHSKPVLYSGYTEWKKTKVAQTVDPEYLLKEFSSCRDCALEHVQWTHTLGPAYEGHNEGDTTLVAYHGDLSGADLQGASLRGAFPEFRFDRADLRGASLTDADLFNASFDHTTVDRTDFHGAVLWGADFTALRFDRPPDFANVTVGHAQLGPFGLDCTRFKDTDLFGTGITFQGLKGDDLDACERTPFLPGSTAPLSLLRQTVELGKRRDLRFDFDKATFVATAADRAELAGADLSGQSLHSASFVGFPVRLVKTDFRGAQLQGVSFDQADLSGANFANANLADSSFRGADLTEQGAVRAATFAGPDTNLTRANFIDADISGASFVGADLSGAVFSHALAVDTNFGGVRAPKAVFAGAHIYGNGRAFDSANNLRDADFDGAVLAGDVDVGGGFDFTHADLADATFDGTQCIGCNFTGSKLDDVRFIGAYLPGAIFTDVESMSGAKLNDAWLYCGDRANRACAAVGNSGERWKWVLELGTDEDYGPVPFRQTNIGNAPLSEVATCPDGKRGSSPPAGCAENLLPESEHAPPIPARCTAAGPGACPTATSTVLDTSSLGQPTALAAVNPANLITTRTEHGVYVAVGNGTIQRVEGGEQRRVAGRPGEICQGGPCGDGGPAKDALLGNITAMAVGVDGSLYLAEPGLHRVRRIDPSGEIMTVAGSGDPCVPGIRNDCGNGVAATRAQLAGPFGVWVDPGGRIYIADGEMGVRNVNVDGEIGSVSAERPDVRGSLVGDASGDLYAVQGDSLLKVDLENKVVKRVVGTGQPGYNGNVTIHGTLAPGTAVQVSHPTGLSVARNGNVLFADSGNNLIRAYVPSSGHVTNVLAGVVADGSPQGGFNGDGHFARETELSGPVAVAAGGNGEFIVADAGNHRVRKFGPGPG